MTPTQNAPLEGKVAIVTGAASGIGQTTAEALASRGATVVVSDVNDKLGESVAEDINERGGEALFVHADVSKNEDMEALVEETLEAFGTLDLAVNNAGIEGELAPTVEYDEASWDKVVDINLKGVFLGLKHQIPAMIDNGGGAIVNTASILGLVAFPTTPAYTASKHGVVGLTKTAALELAEEGVRVNAVCPGFIETPMVLERGVKAGEDPEVYEEIEEMHPMHRLGKPDEIANMIAWLCTDEASFATGQTFTIDGGYTAQ